MKGPKVFIKRIKNRKPFRSIEQQCITNSKRITKRFTIK